MKNNLFTWIGNIGAMIGFYFLGMYCYAFFTDRFVPLMKQVLYFL